MGLFMVEMVVKFTMLLKYSVIFLKYSGFIGVFIFRVLVIDLGMAGYEIIWSLVGF